MKKVFVFRKNKIKMKSRINQMINILMIISPLMYLRSIVYLIIIPNRKSKMKTIIWNSPKIKIKL